ncbi:MAG: hypothetical protein GQ532_10985 [Methylomarinum sp.]|nr:hypothetical protein [Methylomarinum sp.]
MIKIAFRFDDPSFTSDHLLEKNIIEICKRYAVKINFAVIPYKEIDGQLHALNEKKAEHLIHAEKNNWIEISQHGYAYLNQNETGIPYLLLKLSALYFDSKKHIIYILKL